MSPERLEERRQTMFYISPSGKVIRWEGDSEDLKSASIHSIIAEKLIKDQYGEDVSVHFTDVLHKAGYAAIGSEVYGNRIKGEPTALQFDAMKKEGVKKVFDDENNGYDIY